MPQHTQTTATFSRKFLSILFDCCQVYNRIYINAEQTAYVGRCPKCLSQVRVGIGKNGTSARTFRAQ